MGKQIKKVSSRGGPRRLGGPPPLPAGDREERRRLAGEMPASLINFSRQKLVQVFIQMGGSVADGGNDTACVRLIGERGECCMQEGEVERRWHGGPFTQPTHTRLDKRLNLLDDINFLASKEEGGIPGRERGDPSERSEARRACLTEQSH